MKPPIVQRYRNARMLRFPFNYAWYPSSKRQIIVNNSFCLYSYQKGVVDGAQIQKNIGKCDFPTNLQIYRWLLSQIRRRSKNKKIKI